MMIVLVTPAMIVTVTVLIVIMVGIASAGRIKEAATNAQTLRTSLCNWRYFIFFMIIRH